MSPNSESLRRLTWVVVGCGFAVLAVSYAMRAALGLVMPIWESELGWSRSFVSSVGALAFVVMAVIAPLSGRLVDTHGARLTLCLGLAMLALGSLVVAVTENRIVFLLAFSGLSAIGFDIAAWHVVSTAIVRVASSHIGLANGIANTGSSAGHFLVVPLLAVILAAASWRWSFIALAVASAILVPLIWSTLGGAAGPGDRGATAKGTGVATDLAYLVRQPSFRLLFWSFFLCGYTTTGVIETHFLLLAGAMAFFLRERHPSQTPVQA